MIALPILHGDNVLLGGLYCQGPPNSFTERTVTLLKLLVNQIAISIANALLFKQVEKVGARNEAMLQAQKHALIQAREAEKKAKAAEVKAMEMVRLKDEAAKAKSMFLANVSHELRTPLNVSPESNSWDAMKSCGSMWSSQTQSAATCVLAADVMLLIVKHAAGC